MNYCSNCGKSINAGGNFCSACGVTIYRARPDDGVGQVAVSAPLVNVSRVGANEQLLQRIADYERISGILWMILGIVQVLMVVTIIVGIWNIVAAASRLKLRPLILARDARVPDVYEGVTQLVIIGVLNLLLGGVVGVLFVAFDFIIRDMVLSNRHLFDNSSTGVQV